MITVAIHEITQAGASAAPSATFIVPASATGAVKNDRITFKVPVGAQPRIPTHGRIVVSRPGLPDQVTEYNNQIPKFPYERDATSAIVAGAAAAGADSLGDADSSAREAQGVVTLLDKISPAYASLPKNLWVQLNQLSDDVVVQLRLEKLVPALTGSGEFYIYGATLAVVNAKISEAKRIMDI